MKKTVSLILAAMLLFAFTAIAEESEVQTYSWDQYAQFAELMGAEGSFATYDQFSLKLWIPAEFIQADGINENDAANGFIDFFGNDEYPLEIGVQFTNVGEGIDTPEDLLNIINGDDYDAPTLTRINNYSALLLTENNGEHLIVAIAAGDGDFLMIHYYSMNADQWCLDRAALSMASIQSIEE